MTPQLVRAYSIDSSHLALNSSINPGTWFRVTREGLFEDIFPGSEELLKGKGKP